MSNIKIGTATYPFIGSVRKLFKQDVEVVNLFDIKEYDLIVFTGGADIDPAIYGQENRYSYINIERDKKEIEVWNLARMYQIPMFGICRGHQFLNAMMGGKLIQDLYKEKTPHAGYHELTIVKPDSIIGKIYTEVNSLHHQGVETAGRGLKVTSTHKGVIESTESNEERIISVQWHPEFMLDVQADKLAEYLKGWAKNL